MSEEQAFELQARFDRLEKRILSIVTIAMTAMGMVLVILSIFVASLTSEQSQQGKDIDNIKRDLGDTNQVLHKLYPDENVFENNYINYVLKRGGVR
jgi:predicted PurR-regulated permease PerM